MASSKMAIRSVMRVRVKSECDHVISALCWMGNDGGSPLEGPLMQRELEMDQRRRQRSAGRTTMALAFQRRVERSKQLIRWESGGGIWGEVPLAG